MLAEFLKRCRERRVSVAVLGDEFTDEYIHGVVERISPESPCPIFRQIDEPVRFPGGAGNVRRQLEHFNVEVISATYILTIPLKRRFCVGDQVVFRHDEEMFPLSLTDTQKKCVMDKIQSDMLNAMILSDYNNGCLDAELISQIVERCRACGVPVVADHKCRPLDEWRGATVVKMNWEEFRNSDGHFCPLVITRGPDKPFIYSIERGQITYVARDLNVPVRSTIGAGDCFTAFLSLGIAHGFSLDDAAAIAHLAGGAFVQRPFATPIMPHELLAMEDPVQAKVVDADYLVKVHDARWRDKKVVFTNGCFDIIHSGHAHTLRFAKEQGDILIVGLNSDQSVRRIKGHGRPFIDYDNRARVLAALGCVDFVVMFDEDTPESLIEKIKPRLLVKGHDNSDGVPGAHLVESVLMAPDSGIDLHTSLLIERIRSHVKART